jgi:hypothetical protein
MLHPELPIINDKEGDFVANEIPFVILMRFAELTNLKLC